MILLNIKKLEIEIKNRTITPKQFIIYSIFVLGPFLSLLRTSRYPINIEVNNIDQFLSLIPFFIVITKYIVCYKIIKNNNVSLFLYSIIPINFVLNFRYTLIVMIPLIFLSNYLIKYLGIDYKIWNIINLRIISIIFQIIIAIKMVKIYRKLYSSEINICVE